MPIYEYRCQSCGNELEKLQRLNEAPLVECPACGKPELRRLISAAGFRLKGGGWYETDFKSTGKRNLADGPGTGESSSKSDGASSDAPAGKSGSDSGTKLESPSAKSAASTTSEAS